MIGWLVAFLATELCEVPIYLSAFSRGGASISARTILLAFLASAITHPIVWFVFPRLVPGPYDAVTLFSEVFAVVVEAAWLRLFRLRRALLWSIVANGTSVALGSLSRALVGAP